MQCVILAAGKGARMRPITETTPKPLIKVCGKSILDHVAEALPEEIDELVLVVGYKAEQIRKYCGDYFHGRSVQYAEQSNFSGGTGDALLTARPFVSGKFMVLNGDDIYGKEALQRLVKEEHAMFGVPSDTPERFGVLLQNQDGTLKSIIEKPTHPESNLVNINGYVIHDFIFDYEVPVSHLGELLATDFITAYTVDHPIKIVEQDRWLPIGYPEDIAKAEAILCPQKS